MGAFEVFGYAYFLCYGVFSKESGSRDFLLLLPLMLAVAVSFSNKSVLRDFFLHPIFNWLGKFSLSIYLTQGMIRQALSDLALDWDLPALCALYAVSVLVMSLLNFWIGGKLAKSVDTVRKALFLVFLLMVVAEALRIMCNALGV